MDLDFRIVLKEKTPSYTLITIMCLINFGKPKIIYFLFATKGKSIILDVQIFKHIRVYKTDFNVCGNLGGEKMCLTAD